MAPNTATDREIRVQGRVLLLQEGLVTIFSRLDYISLFENIGWYENAAAFFTPAEKETVFTELK